MKLDWGCEMVADIAGTTDGLQMVQALALGVALSVRGFLAGRRSRTRLLNEGFGGETGVSGFRDTASLEYRRAFQICTWFLY